MRKLKILVKYEHGGNCVPFGASYVRLLCPLSHLVNERAFEVTRSTGLGCRGADVVIVDRQWRPDLTIDMARKFVQAVRRAGACLIHALDDNLLDLDSLPPEKSAVLGYLAREADGMIVATAPLAERLREVNANVHVVPNAVDERLFVGALAPRPRAEGPLVVGYMGTFTHDRDLRIIAEGLRRALQRHRDQVEFHLVGAVREQATVDAFAGTRLRIISTPPALREYPHFARWMVQHMRFDVGIAPLEDNPFTRCKSDLKFLDYGVLGIPGVFSRVGPYAATVRHLETGYLAENVPEAWEEAIDRLLTDAALRESLARRAQNYVVSHRTLALTADKWQMVISSIWRNSPAASGRNPRPAAVAVAAPAAVIAAADEPAPDVDVILGVYNEPHLAAACIDSLLAHTEYPRWRLLLMDDQSDDVTRELLANYARMHPNVELHRNPRNLGFVGSYNRGLGLARAKYVVLLNSDTVVPPHWLERLVRTAEADPTVALVNPLSNQFVNMSVAMAPGTSFATMDALLQNETNLRPFDACTTVGYCLLVRRAALDRHGLLDEVFGRGYCEDSDLHMRLVANGWRAVAAPDVYVYHLGSGTFTPTTRNERFEKNCTIFRSRWGSRYDADIARFRAADPMRPILERFAPEPRGRRPLARLSRRVRRAVQRASHIAQRGASFLTRNREQLLPAALHPRRTLAAARSRLKRLAAAPNGPAPGAIVPLEECLPRRAYLERNTRPQAPSVVFVMEGVGLCGGCMRVIDLVNRLVALGIEARLAVMDRARVDFSCFREAYFSPMCFAGLPDMLANFPRCHVAVATLWLTAPPVRQLADAGRVQTAAYFLQDYEAWFYADQETRDRVFATYPLIAHRVATSHWLRRLLANHEAEARVIPLGFDALRFYPRPRTPRSKVRLIAMARPETPRRGFSALVAALQRVHAARPDVEFALFGSQALTEVGDLGFPLVNLGVVKDRASLCRHYNEADIFFDPSPFQGFGLPALEAMACQVACVLTNFGGVEEYARDNINSLMVPPDAPEAHAAAILRLVDDPALRMRLAVAGRQTVEQMSPRSEAEAWAEYLACISPAFRAALARSQPARMQPFSTAVPLLPFGQAAAPEPVRLRNAG